jgi:hypothetical protein
MPSPKEVFAKAVIAKVEKPEVDNSGIKELISRAFSTRNLLHFNHWQNPSFAAHLATGDLYDGIINKIDDIVETYMGKFGKFTIDSQPASTMPECICKHVKKEAEWMCDNKAKIANGSEPVLNMLADLEGLYSKSVFKLENLG